MNAGYAAYGIVATSSRSTRSSACRKRISTSATEDTIVITDTGYQNFTDFLPAKLDEIEKLVREKGIVQKVPPSPEAGGRMSGAGN